MGQRASWQDGNNFCKWTDNNPFEDPYPDRQYVITGDENDEYGPKVYYIDYGTHFEVGGMNYHDADADLIHKIEEEVKTENIHRKQEQHYNTNHGMNTTLISNAAGVKTTISTIMKSSNGFSSPAV